MLGTRYQIPGTRYHVQHTGSVMLKWKLKRLFRVAGWTIYIYKYPNINVYKQNNTRQAESEFVAYDTRCFLVNYVGSTPHSLALVVRLEIVLFT